MNKKLNHLSCPVFKTCNRTNFFPTLRALRGHLRSVFNGKPLPLACHSNKMMAEISYETSSQNHRLQGHPHSSVDMQEEDSHSYDDMQQDDSDSRGDTGIRKDKSCLFFSGELGLNIYVVSLSNKGLTDATLSELLSETPTRCILLLEDIDAAFVQQSKGDNMSANNITFSGLLNAIDGVVAQEGRILCMTTNHLERLDNALIRPGRIDVRVHFGHATRHQAAELFSKFYPKISQDSELARSFAEKIPENTFSMAHLQGFLMGHKKQPEEAVKSVEEWIESHKTGKDTSTEGTIEDY